MMMPGAMAGLYAPPASTNTRKTVHLLQIGLVVVGVVAALALAMIVFLFTNQSVTSRIVEDGSIREVDVQDGAISQAKIGSAAVTREKMAPNAVSTEAIATSAVQEAQIAAAAVTTNKLGSASVTTDKLGSLSVTAEKISRYVDNHHAPAVVSGPLTRV